MSCCIIINIVIKMKYNMPTNEFLNSLNTTHNFVVHCIHHHSNTSFNKLHCLVIYLIIHEMTVVSMNTINASLFR